jgi:predicted nucleic acid-binding protein
MTRYFADTFYYIALLSDRDEAHEYVVELNKTLTGGIVTTQWVLTEVGDAFSASDQRPLFLELLEVLESDPDTLILEASAGLFERGVDLYRRRPDKDWPLTDCISFVVMEEQKLTLALTGDHHFEQAGYVAVLE